MAVFFGEDQTWLGRLTFGLLVLVYWVYLISLAPYSVHLCVGWISGTIDLVKRKIEKFHVDLLIMNLIQQKVKWYLHFQRKRMNNEKV